MPSRCIHTCCATLGSSGSMPPLLLQTGLQQLLPQRSLLGLSHGMFRPPAAGSMASQWARSATVSSSGRKFNPLTMAASALIEP